jgi:2-polyprenyl-3-methyl-5-hydroxy-6-metoxy-1,4-benzoquinol methylase
VAEPSGLRPDDPSFDISDAEDVHALHRAETSHFWHRARNRIIVSKLRALGVLPGATFLDLGCGAGCVAGALCASGYRVTGVDGHRALLDVAARRVPAATFLQHDLRQGTKGLALEPFDAAGLFDVIEHLNDPANAIADALDRVRPAGRVVGTVPALMSLWSAIDEHAGHVVRYDPGTLRAALSRVAGARILEITPFFRALVPLMAVQRRVIARRPGPAASVRNLTVPWAPLNAALYALAVIDNGLAPVLDRTPIPGASIWFALERR